MKASSYHCLEFKPDRLTLDNMAKSAFFSRKLAYKKIKGGYKVYCGVCHQYKNVSDEEFKQIRMAKLCPSCFNEIQTTTIDNTKERYWIAMKYNGCIFGYKAIISWDFGKKLRISSVDQVFYENAGVCYRKNVVKVMGWQLGETYSRGWRECGSDYLNFFHIYPDYSDWQKRVLTKKEYYMLSDIGKLTLKDNQKKIIKESYINSEQAKYLKLFNLKSIDEVFEYRIYIASNKIYRSVNNYPELNIYYLDYLRRNNIPIALYLDYLDQCKTIGIKPEKPKDFSAEHERLSEIIEEMELEAYTKQIQERFELLRGNIYHAKNVSIKPFKSDKEIVKTGKQLHNCLANYTKDYANGKTDIYYIAVNGRKIGAVEICNDMLEQAYGKSNKELSKDIKSHVKRWCKFHNWNTEEASW